MILPCRSSCLLAVFLQSLGGVLNTLLLRYHHQKRNKTKQKQTKNHTGLSQGALVATQGHNSTQLPCGWRVPSGFLQQLCVDEQIHHPASTINALKLHAAAVQSARVKEGQFLDSSSGDTAHHYWDCCVPASRTEPSSLIRRHAGKTNSWSVIAIIKSGTEALMQEFMKPPVTSHLHQ